MNADLDGEQTARRGRQSGPTPTSRSTGDPDATSAVRFNIYQSLTAANGSGPRVNIGANSLSGERYRGHAFWDTEVFMLPFFTHRPPGQHDPGTAGATRPRGRCTAARSSLSRVRDQ